LFVVFFTLLPQIAVAINASMTGGRAIDLIKFSEEGEFYVFAAAISAHSVGSVLISMLRVETATGTDLHTRVLVMISGLMVVFIASLSYMALLANKGPTSHIDLLFVSHNSMICAGSAFLIGLGVMLVEEE
jgi:hypothetical protein